MGGNNILKIICTFQEEEYWTSQKDKDYKMDVEKSRQG